MRIVIWTLMGITAACSTTGGGQDAGPPPDVAGDPGVVDRGGDPGEDLGWLDPGSPDAGVPDPGVPDDTVADPGRPDPGIKDPGTPDPGEGDPGTADGGTSDPGVLDAGGEPGPDPGPDVADLCPSLADDYFGLAEDLAACQGPGECTRIPSAICAYGKGCGGLLVSSAADLGALQAKAQEYQAMGCPLTDETCQCPQPVDFGYGCEDGTCVACTYQCDLSCPCAKDEAGCDLPECDEAACDEALAAVDQFVAAHGACTDAQQCVAFEYPICDTFGCFQVAVNAQADLATLTDLAIQAQAAGCEDFSCGCEAPPPAPACIEGLCRLCPPDCGTTCEGIGAAILAEADTLNHCEWTDECWTEDTGVCNLPGLPCGYVPVQAGSNTDLIYELAQAYVALECQTGCSCEPPPETLYCIGGRCLAEPTCEQLIAHAQALLADPASTTCALNTDCQLVHGEVPPVCAPDNACWCAVAVNAAALVEFEYLMDAIQARGCGTGGLCACDAVECSEPKAACAAGSCVLE